MALYTGSFIALRGSARIAITNIGSVVAKSGQEHYTRYSIRHCVQSYP